MKESDVNKKYKGILRKTALLRRCLTMHKHVPEWSYYFKVVN